MAVSNMDDKKKLKVKREPSANKIQVIIKRPKFRKEEFGSELNVSSEQANSFAKTQKAPDNKKPVSERTAWH